MIHPFRWLADKYLRFRARWAVRRDEIGKLVVQIEIERERHRRELEAKDSTIALQAKEIKLLLAMHETAMAKTAAMQAALGRQQAEAENGGRRPPAAGGMA